MIWKDKFFRQMQYLVLRWNLEHYGNKVGYYSRNMLNFMVEKDIFKIESRHYENSTAYFKYKIHIWGEKSSIIKLMS